MKNLVGRIQYFYCTLFNDTLFTIDISVPQSSRYPYASKDITIKHTNTTYKPPRLQSLMNSTCIAQTRIYYFATWTYLDEPSQRHILCDEAIVYCLHSTTRKPLLYHCLKHRTECLSNHIISFTEVLVLRHVGAERHIYARYQSLSHR
jgi:hypothetical protein